jgi:hypothetical protein
VSETSQFFIDKVVEIYVDDSEQGEVPSWDDESVEHLFNEWANELEIEAPSEKQCRKYIAQGKRQFLEDNPGAKVEPAAEPEEVEAKDFSTDRTDSDQQLDVYVQDSEFPEYATNWDGTVISLGGARRKKGKRMRLDVKWIKTPGGKFYPQAFFRLSKGEGPRAYQTTGQMMARRLKTLLQKTKDKDL